MSTKTKVPVTPKEAAPAVELTPDEKLKIEISDTLGNKLITNELVTDSDLLPDKQPKKQELAVINKTDLILTRLEERTAPLRAIVGIPTDKQFNEIENWRKLAKKIRTAGKNITEEGREELKRQAGLWIEAEKNFINRIKSNVEDKLEELSQAYKVEEQRIKDEKLQAQGKRKAIRQNDLATLGVLYDSSKDAYVFGELSVQRSIIEEADDDIYNVSLEAFKEHVEESNRENEINLRKSRSTLLLAIGVTEDQPDLGKMSANDFEILYRDKKFAFDQEKIKKDADLIAARIDTLKELGFNVDGDELYYGKDKNVKVDKSQLVGDDVDFKNLYMNLSHRVLEEQKRADELEVYNTRTAMLKAIATKYDGNDLGSMPEKEFQKRYEAALKVFNDRIAKNKADELKKQGEAVQWKAFVKQVKELKVPSLKSPEYSNLANRATDYLKKIQELQ